MASGILASLLLGGAALSGGHPSCGVDSAAPLYARVEVGETELPVALPDGPVESAAFPDMMVDGWAVHDLPLGTALRELGAEAGFEVSAADLSGTASWDGRPAPLGVVVASLVSDAGYRYSFDGKTVEVVDAPEKKAWTLELPENEDHALAIIDAAMRSGLEEPVVTGMKISFSAAEPAARAFAKEISSSADITAFDVLRFRVRPEAGRYDFRELRESGEVISEKSEDAGGLFVLRGAAPADVEAFFEERGDLGGIVRQSAASWAAPFQAVSLRLSDCGGYAADVPVRLKPVAVEEGLEIGIRGPAGAAVTPALQYGDFAILVTRTPSGGWLDVVAVRSRLLALR